MHQEETQKFNNSINKFMMEMEKEDIYDAANYHGLEITEEMSKEKLVEILSNVLVEDFEADCQYLLENEFFYLTSLYLYFEKGHPTEGKAILKAILEANQYERDEMDGDFFIDRGYFQRLRKDEDNSLLFPYPPITVSFLKQFTGLIEKTKTNQKKLDLMIALTNIYGCYTYSQYVHIWNLYNKEPLTVEEAEDFFDVMETRGFHFWLMNRYVINDIITVEEFSLLLKDSQNRPWYTPSEETIKQNVEIIDPASSEYSQFEKFFKQHRGNLKTKKQREEIIWLLLFEMKYDSPPSVSFDILNEKNYIFNTDKEAQEFMKILQNVSNNSRKWSLRGFTPNEVHTLFRGF